VRKFDENVRRRYYTSFDGEYGDEGTVNGYADGYMDGSDRCQAPAYYDYNDHMIPYDHQYDQQSAGQYGGMEQQQQQQRGGDANQQTTQYQLVPSSTPAVAQVSQLNHSP